MVTKEQGRLPHTLRGRDFIKRSKTEQTAIMLGEKKVFTVRT